MIRVTRISVLLLLTACFSLQAKEYEIAPIPGAAECVLECETAKQQCRDQIDFQGSQCKKMYQQAKRDYDFCIARGGTSGRCKQPKRCPVKRNSKCNKAYDKCFVACGGRIE
jgi:hypothetical protein